MLKKETREMFRDKKSLSMMLIIPIMIPVLVIGMSALFESQVNKSVEEYNKIGFDYQLNDVESKIAESLQIEVSINEQKKLEQEYEKGNLDLYVTKKDHHYIIHGKDNETTSYATSLTDQFFTLYKEHLQQEYLSDNHIDPEEVVSIITIEEDIKATENFYANYIIESFEKVV